MNLKIIGNALSRKRPIQQCIWPRLRRRCVINLRPFEAKKLHAQIGRSVCRLQCWHGRATVSSQSCS